jgi:hypothetical protein
MKSRTYDSKRFMKLQSAMEYLMTYGWAILIIAVVLGVLFQLGVFSSSSFALRASPGSCQVFRPNGPGTGTNVNLVGVCNGQVPQYVLREQNTGYLTIQDSKSLDFQIGTFSVWSKIESAAVPGWVYYISKQSYGVDGYFFGLGSSGGAYMFAWTGGTIRNQCNGVGSSLIDGKWHNVIASYDGNIISTYVDGINVCTYNYGSYLVMGASTTAALTLGSASGGQGTWQGNLANVQVYNMSLSTSDVQTLYSRGVGGAPIYPRYLAGWWPLNGDAKDYSGNNNQGVPTSASYSTQWLSGYTTP